MTLCPNEIPVNKNPRLTAALKLAQQGFHILPLRPGDKRPLTTHGFKDAQPDQQLIKDWWKEWPDANIGIATGSVSAAVVIDIDPRNKGDQTLMFLEELYGPLPRTVESRTGGGGRHLFFKYPDTPIKSRANGIGQGLDVKANGGYIVAPPSIHPNGEPYSWLPNRTPGEIDIAEAPDWLLDRLRTPASDKNGKSTTDAEPIVEGVRNRTLTSLAGSMRRPGMSEQEILAALRQVNQDRCIPPLDDDELKTIAHSVSKYKPADGIYGINGGVETDWHDPQPLPDELPPVLPFDCELLPEAFRPWIEDITSRIQCPPDFPAVSAVTALAAIVGRKIAICPKRYDDWLVVPNLWSMVIGRPGIMKTPAIQETLKPLQRLEIEAKEAYDNEKKKHEAATLITAEQEKLTKSKIQKTLKGGKDAHEIALSHVNKKEPPPARRRYLANDTTVEKLGVILNENPNGLMVYRDELIGYLRSLEKEGHESARAFYLEAWNGNGRYTYDRIGRGTIDIEAAIVSIIGAIQPGPLGGYIRQAIKNGQGDDGLLQRFQLAVWPDISPEWLNEDQWPDNQAKREAYNVFANLDRLDPRSIGASQDPFDNDGIPYLKFDDESQDRFDKWRHGLELRIRSGSEHPAMESHLAKYRSLIPSLALLIHLADGGSGPVGLESIEKAIRWGEYLESHARRIYSVAIKPGITAAKALVKHIEKGDLQDDFSLKDVYRPCWTGLSSREEALTAVDVLIDYDWIIEIREPTGGRTKTRYRINPKIKKA